MKISAFILALAISASAWTATAQDPADPPPPGQGRPDGRGRGGFGGGGPGNFDPAQFQQMMMDNYRQQFAFTNDEEWNAIRPLIQKVLDAQQEVRQFSGRGGRGGFGGPGGPGGGPGGFGGRGGPFGGQSNPSADALQAAIDSNSKEKITAALVKYREARKQAQDKLTATQDGLKKFLTLKQEAIAVRLGLAN